MKKFLKLDKLYSYNYSEKKFFDKKIFELIAFHKKKSKQFNKITSYFNIKSFKNLSDIPPIPITAFKKYDLLSIKNIKIFKTLQSSGTSGTSTSKIFLDAENSKNQTWVLSKIMENIFGNKRLPMLIVENQIIEFWIGNTQVLLLMVFLFFQTKDILYLMRMKNKLW